MADRTHLQLFFHSFMNYESLRIGTEMERDRYGDDVRVGKEVIFSLGYSYTIPTASFLKVGGKKM